MKTPPPLSTAEVGLIVHSLRAYIGEAKRERSLNRDMWVLIDRVRSTLSGLRLRVRYLRQRGSTP
jgi:hypothetical protein